MPDPEGRLTTPVGINADGLPRAWTALWGYSDRYAERITTDDPGDGNNYLYSSIVPEGYIYRVEYVGCRFRYGTIDAIVIAMSDTDNRYWFLREISPDQRIIYRLNCPFTLKAGDRVRASFVGCSGVGYIKMDLWGHKMEL